MKKILIIILLLVFTITNTYSYTPKDEDKQIAAKLSLKINKIIEKKGEKSRELFVKKLLKLKEKTSDNGKLTYIIGEILNNINGGLESIENIIDEVESMDFDEKTNLNDNNSALLLLGEYNSMYSKFIDNNIYGTNGSFKDGCGTFSVRWGDVYREQFQNIYNISYDFKNKFLVDLIEYDLNELNTYFKKVCKNDARIKNIEYKDSIYSDFSNEYVNAYYLSVYLSYNNWYYRLYDYFQDKLPSVTCHNVMMDWDDFTYNKLEYIKKYTKQTSTPFYYDNITKLQDKYRKMMKDECAGIKIK